MALARKNAGTIRDHIREVFIAVGDRDTSRGSTLDSNTKLHQLLDELKVPNQFTVVPGVKHSYQNLCQDVSVVEKHIQFYADLFGKK
jgi:acetyl esterase/lipase